MENLKLLSKIALSFQNLTNFEKEIQSILKDIGIFSDLNRIFLFFEKPNDNGKMNFEWCNDGVSTMINEFEDVSCDDFSFLFTLLKKDGFLRCNNVDEISPKIINVLHFKELKSILIYPLIIQKELRGFISFNECRYVHTWTEEELEILSTVAVLLSSAFERKIYQEELISSETNFHNFFETSTDMFIVSNLQGHILHCNKALVLNLGYSFSELKNMNIIELHPLEHRETASRVVAKMVSGETSYCPLELEGKLGDLFSVETKIWFGKWNNKDCLYIISKDVTKEDENIKLFSKIFENNPVPMFIVDREENRFTKVNQVFLDKTGYSEIELLGKTFEGAGFVIDTEKFRKIRNERIKTGRVINEPLLIKTKDGSMINGLFSVEEISSQGKKSLLIVMVDITAEQEQSLELERFFSINLDLLCIADINGYFIKTNKAWEDILGYSTLELQGRKFLDFIHPEDIESTLEAIANLEEGKKVVEFVNRYISVDGKYHYIEWRSNPYGKLIYAAARDITERIEYEKTIIDVSNKDSLTNIYNRRYIYNRTEEIIEKYKRDGTIFSVCILDIDHFKLINDSYGHQIGDSVLKEFTNIITEELRPYDLLGRYGGEEFIIILINTDKKEGYIVIERILNIIRNKNFVFNKKKIQFTFTAGIASCHEIAKQNLQIDKLVELADKRMYEAKNAGRNQIAF